MEGEMEKVINVYTDDWITQVAPLAKGNHLICTGKRTSLQWFGTQLIQALGATPDSETSSIYGKQVVKFEDFCYQLCHATPWGFEMGRNMNAVVDVIRGENSPQHKFFIFYDAQFLYLDNFRTLKAIFEAFLAVGEEYTERGQNLKLILLMEEQENVRVRRLIKHKEKYPIEVLRVVSGGL